MSDILSSSIVKATKGDYDIPIKSLWVETWRQLIKMPKAFWLGFGLVILIWVSTIAMSGLTARLYDVVMWFAYNFSAHVAPPITQAPISIKIKFFGIAILEVLRFLLTASLALLALNHLRNQTIKASMIFEWHKAWFSLLLIGILFCLFYAAMFYVSILFFKALYGFAHSHPAKLIFLLGYSLRLIIIAVLHTYIMLILFMASLLILDQKMTFKKSLCVAFKSINRHALKNITLLFLASWAYMGAWSDFINLFLSIRNGFGLFAYLIFLPGVILAVWFILYKKLYKKMAGQTHVSQMKKVALVLLKLVLGLVIFQLFFSGVGLIWLLPVVSLLLAIQYQHIFLDKSLPYVTF